MTSNGLWRSQKPVAYKAYIADGSGRDQHVTMTQGGFIRPVAQKRASLNMTAIGEDRFDHNTRTLCQSQVNLARGHQKAPPAFHYRPDGNGRDSYILASNGGFIEKYTNRGGVTASYASQLRKYDKVSLRTLEHI